MTHYTPFMIRKYQNNSEILKENPDDSAIVKANSVNETCGACLITDTHYGLPHRQVRL